MSYLLLQPPPQIRLLRANTAQVVPARNDRIDRVVPVAAPALADGCDVEVVCAGGVEAVEVLGAVVVGGVADEEGDEFLGGGGGGGRGGQEGEEEGEEGEGEGSHCGWVVGWWGGSVLGDRMGAL